MIDELDLEELTRPGAMVPVDLMTTAALVKHVLRLRLFLSEIAAMGPADEEWDADTLESAVILAKRALAPEQKDAE